MSDKHSPNSNHEDIVTLRDLLTQRIDDLDSKVELRFILSQEAIKKAELIADQRLEGLNEWRLQHKDIIAQLASRREVDNQIKTLWTTIGIVVVAIVTAFIAHIFKG